MIYGLNDNLYNIINIEDGIYTIAIYIVLFITTPII